MTIPLVVVGAGGFGRETLDVVEAMNLEAPRPVFEILGVVDRDPSSENLARLRDRGVAYLGSESEWLMTGPRASYLIGIGSPMVRHQIERRFGAAGLTAAIAVHPEATLGSRVRIGAGSVICAGVRVSTNVSIGRHVHLNSNALVGHDSTLADFVSVNPGAVISGEVNLGHNVLVGAGAVVLQMLTVGEEAIIGASACVTKSVASGKTVKGVPAT